MTSKKTEINIGTKGPVNDKGKVNDSAHPGLLGKFFGGVENAPTSISGTVVVLLIGVATAITFSETKIEACDFWKSVVLPTITALFGFLFGKSRK